MVAGHLQVKNGDWYIVLNYKTPSGKRQQKWYATGLPERGNKKKAEVLLWEYRRKFVIPEEVEAESDIQKDMLFADYMEKWLEIIRPNVAVTTYRSYSDMVRNKICPYFRKKDIKLSQLQAKDIQAFYTHELKSISANSVIHEHANIHKALKYAVKMDLLLYNPADKVDRPKKEKYVADYYRVEELETLFNAFKGHKLELLVQMTAFYGFRRSEALGLRWDAIDFERNTITIKHTILETVVDGKKMVIGRDTTKTKSSMRTLPLVNGFREKLLELKEAQKINMNLCGDSYNHDFDGYVFVDPVGYIFTPDQVTETFGRVLKSKGLRQIRFHDLRHSCASLLLAKGVSMKEIQEWLGHSDIGTTANIYSHLDFNSKISSAKVMDGTLKIPDSEIKKWDLI